MIVLSLFDGMSCGLTALKRAGIPVTKYYASEIDKYAIQIAQKNHPEIIQLGDVENWEDWDIEKPDLIIGGSPCQGFSFAGKQLAFDDPRSKLFFTMMDIIEHYKPKYKMLENVRMKKEYLDVISEYMECEPVFINSALVSAQNRQRYYWANWDFEVPEDKGILLKDILECQTSTYVKVSKKGVYKMNQDKASCLTGGGNSGGNHSDMDLIGRCFQVGTATDIKGHDSIRRIYSVWGKSPTITAASGGNQEKKIALDDYTYRRLTPVECERLQTLPDDYTAGVSNTQRYKMLGNGWTVDVIAHIFLNK